MNRRIAVVGDSLSSGGTISPYSGPPFLVRRHQAALIGGSAFCIACQSTGIIAKAGGPYRLKFQGEIALDRDIVLCGCATPPHIIALHAGEAWCDDGLKGLGEVVSCRTITGRIVSIKKGAFDEQVEAKTSGSTAHGPEGYPYYIEMADGRIQSGALDASGKLPRIHTGDGSGDYTVYWGDEAISKKHNGVSHA
ncbi:PAAR domain-containing protein [Burkholderia stagnalis]|uniref:PAAR domain-containing protein n=1 Tax=Burkholderia stagnalis TaxID=1503054 RepID=A0ABX9YT52_9BURK|nr:PAAR domain-containing protein [Burkholderia stagnalis]MDY7803817.1 PAAR domain-containing protein [Burkholderia stagnalis]RQQ62440.1 PAAR domain-containing protein [Burkholderia stagnalis]RQQ72227.1 PAAR domain-containing protein [Burkholderia stagnalis]RQQ73510.1 PAAR domain-containing protein [Burkholderia stagnalis]RQQ85569.1 PAAR domain-containing protein [Burkholderia stagnalis]